MEKRIKLPNRYIVEDENSCGCQHITGFGGAGDENWLFYGDSAIKDIQKKVSEYGYYGDVETLFNFCPICGKRLLLQHNNDEVTIL